jgi:hypothetical protein
MIINNRASGPSYSANPVSSSLHQFATQRHAMGPASTQRAAHTQRISPMELYPELFADQPAKAHGAGSWLRSLLARFAAMFATRSAVGH